MEIDTATEVRFAVFNCFSGNINAYAISLQALHSDKRLADSLMLEEKTMADFEAAIERKEILGPHD